MKQVESVCTSARAYHMSLRYHFRNPGDHFVMRSTDSSPVAVDDLADKKRHDLTLKIKIAKDIVIDLLQLTWPAWVSCIGFSLMYKDTFDHTVLLGKLRHLYESRIWIIIVSGKHSLHPARCPLLHIVRDAVRKEGLDVTSSDRNMNDADLYILGKFLDKSPSEIISGSKTCVRAAERWNGGIPLSLFPSHFRIVHNRHHPEAVAHILKILLLYAGIALHIGLAEAEIDMKIRVLRKSCCSCQQCGDR